MNSFFTLNDNFEMIINKNLNKVLNIEQIKTGWTNFVFTAKKNDGNVFFFRFPRNDFFARKIVKEVKFNNFIKDKISIKTTNLQLFYDNNRPYSVHKQINGKNLYEVYDKMTEKQKQQLADDISLFLLELQSINCKNIDFIETLSSFLYELAEISKIEGCEYNFNNHCELINKEKFEPMVLNHGDLNPGNILMNNDYKIEAIIDFVDY